MKIDKKDVKRCVVFPASGRDSAADEYVNVLLEGFREVAGEVTDRADVEKLADYDEVIFCEDDFYGPFYPFLDMFDEMRGRDVDAWGLTDSCADSFFVCRKSLLTSPELGQYLNSRGNFLAFLDKHGCRWASYLDAEELSGYSDAPMRDFPRYLLEEKKSPLLCKETFYGDYARVLDVNSGESAREALDYIDRQLSYDSALIWKNLLATQNMADLKKRLQLNYVLSSRLKKPRTGKIRKIALQMHIYYEDQAEICRHYAESMPRDTHVFITVPSEEKKKIVDEAFDNFPYPLEIRVIGNRGRDVGSLLTAFKDMVFDYDLICSVHDKKVTQVEPMSLGNSWSYKCFENLLKNKTLVENVIVTFEENPCLGMLEPPVPNHGPYYPITGKGEWGSNYPKVKEWADKLGIQVDISPDKEPVAPLGTMFWVRPLALRALYDHDWQYEEYPKEPNKIDASLLHAIERLYPFCVQACGYYPAWVMVDTYGRVELDNWEYTNRELFKAEMDQWGQELSFRELIAEAEKQRPAWLE